MKSGDAASVERLIKEKAVDVNATDSRGATALHKACKKGEHISLLLSHPKIDVLVTDRRGNTALHVLCRYFVSKSIINVLPLMIKKGIRIRIRTRVGVGVCFLS